ncbi:MAG: homocysteine S-methyltransferase family protein [Candidatus Kaelpia aquatica]|nr:homocysteine S-methyltransferase family protein [Candidatus Kaelpia aquatica]
MKIESILKRRALILDGACGTSLYDMGMPSGVLPEIWCLENRDALRKLHKSYIEAGSDVIYSATFGANRIKLGDKKIDIVGLNKKLALIAKDVAGSGRVLVAGDISSTGKFVKPFGELDFNQAVDIFKEQVKGLLEADVDLFVIETMMDIQEARAALIAVREMSDKFTIVTMSYEKSGRTLNGTDPLSALITLESLGASAVGANCSSGPLDMKSVILKMKDYTNLPLVAKPNAGMPKVIAGETVFDMSEDRFAKAGKDLILSGVSIIGGCCGTTSRHIAALKRELKGLKPASKKLLRYSTLSSAASSLVFDKNSSLIAVGEKINPSGKKRLQKSILDKNYSLIRNLAREQELSGAKLLDLNVSVLGANEGETMLSAISVLAVSSKLPLLIDSLDPDVIEAALRFYPGRAMVNSISGESEKLKKLLPVIKKYGAMFILLPLTSVGIPRSFRKRRETIDRLIKKVKDFGIKKESIVVDGITLAVSAEPEAGVELLKTIEYISKELKMNTIIGLSNISFGLPRRDIINKTFLSLAEEKGLNLAILDSYKIKNSRKSKYAKSLLLVKDRGGRDFIKRFSNSIAAQHPVRPINIELDSVDFIKDKISRSIIEGDRDLILELIKSALAKGVAAIDIVNKIMIPSISTVGERFDNKECFLPQLISSAEVVKKAFSILEPYLKEDNSKRRALVMIATVEGDIHDIGKNIVALIMGNYGFSVIDLGKDVSAKIIVREIKRYKPDIVGLSALMTTTMVNMEKVLMLVRKEKLKVKFMLGGAVVTDGYAKSLKASYAKDAIEAVRVAKKILSK